MSGGDTVSLEFLAAQQHRILSELAVMRGVMADQGADMAVLLAVAQRLDATVSGLTAEVRALHGQIGRVRARLPEAAP